MRSVLHGDTVRVRVVGQDRKLRPEGRVLEILDRRKSLVLGRLLHETGVWVVAPEDRRFGQDILIPKGGTASAQAGQVVAVELTEPPSLHSQPVGRVVEVLGQIDDPGIEIEIAVRKYGVPHQFSQAALDQAQAFAPRVGAADRKGRVDLRDIAFVTIDGEDARDFDDAVYCEPFEWDTEGGRASGWRLLVAIADVSHYVRPGDPLDAQAYERATSVYFPRRVIPMLPERLSNGLCSLNPQVDRLTLVCDMVIDGDGLIVGYQFYNAVICSAARLTYTEVADALANTHGPAARALQPLLTHLIDLHSVYLLLLRQRERRGAIDFETTETQIVCDASGRIEKIVPRTRTQAHRLIEEAMLAANVCAAEFIAQSGHPGLYRVHEGPTPEKRVALQDYLRALGLGLHLSEDPSPAQMQAIAQATKDRSDAAQIHQMLLRSMQQAIYSPHNSGHFGLAFGAYTHFTSPIRRYPDLLVHRVIKSLLRKKTYPLTPPGPSWTPPRGRHPAARAASPTPGEAIAKRAGSASARADLVAWEVAGAHTSACERRADEASRDVEAWLKCRFMRDRLGEVFVGTVSSVAAFGLFVTLDTLYVEGLVHITELGGEYWRFDEVRQELRGERSGMRYAVGAKVQVQVSRVDLDARKMDFRLIRDDDAAQSTLLNRGRIQRPLAGPVPASAEEALQRLAGEDRAAKRAAKKAAQKAAKKATKKPVKKAVKQAGRKQRVSVAAGHASSSTRGAASAKSRRSAKPR